MIWSIMEKPVSEASDKHRESMRDILTIMHKGWKIHEESWNPKTEKYEIDKIAAMTQAVGGDADVGNLVYLFEHNGNDIQGSSLDFGIGWGKNQNVLTNIPPRPEKIEGFYHIWNIEREEWEKKKDLYTPPNAKEA